MKVRNLIICLCAASLAAAGGGAVNPGAPSPQERPVTAGPQNEVSVILKLVQVFVIDRYGRPVTGLGQADFELLDNGRPQTIAAFEAHSLALPERPSERPAEAAAPLSAKPAAVQGRKFYFVFDYFMNDQGGIRLAKKAALQFMDSRLMVGDAIGVLSLSTSKGLQVHRELSTDRESAKKAVREMSEVPRLRDVESVYVLNRPSLDQDDYDETGAENEYKLEECVRYVDELKNLAQALKAVEGLKNVVFFSRGLALGSLLEGGRQLMDTGTGTFVMDHYVTMLKDFSRSASPVYAVNTEGTRRPPAPGTDLKSESLANGASALVGLTDASGGIYFPTASHALELTEKINDTTAHYYVLGYSIPLAWDGRYHELTVRVKRPGCQVRAQAGYYDPKQYADLTPVEKEIQLMDVVRGKASPFLAPADIPLRVLPFSAGPEAGGASCFLMAELALPELAELAGAKSELAFFVFDDRGGAVWSRKSEVDLSGISAPVAYAYSPIPLLPGRYESRFALRNAGTGMTALGSTSFVIQALPERGPAPGEDSGFRLDPPLLIRPGRDAVFLRATEEKERAVLPSLVTVYPFASVQAAPVVGVLEAGAAPLEAVVRVSREDGSSLPDLDWSALFVRLDSRRNVPAKAREIMNQTAGAALVFLLEIERPDLEPAEYVLEIRAVDESSGREAGTEVRVRVK